MRSGRICQGNAIQKLLQFIESLCGAVISYRGTIPRLSAKHSRDVSAKNMTSNAQLIRSKADRHSVRGTQMLGKQVEVARPWAASEASQHEGDSSRGNEDRTFLHTAVAARNRPDVARAILKNLTEWCLSAVQRFVKFLQELSSTLPPLRARIFKIQDVRKYPYHHYHYHYHCHHH